MENEQIIGNDLQKRIENLNPKCDLMFIIDVTESMSRFLETLEELFRTMKDLLLVTNLFERVSVLAFRDYCSPKLFEWSDWIQIEEFELLIKFVSELEMDGGGDVAEAVKSALWEAYSKIENPTVVILYTDALPHHKYKKKELSENDERELKALGNEKFNWLNTCKQAEVQNLRIFPLIFNIRNIEILIYDYLARKTGGSLIVIPHPTVLNETTIGIFLNICGLKYNYDGRVLGSKNWEVDALDQHFNYSLIKDFYYTYPPVISTIKNLEDKPKDLIHRFKVNKEFQDVVFQIFDRMFTPENISSFTNNILYGKLWRAICKKRNDTRREILITRLCKIINQASYSKKISLQSFLKKTYNSTDEINKIIKESGDYGPFYVIDSCDKNITRKNLYEIGLSCAPNIVRSVLKMHQEIRISNIKPTKKSKISYIPVHLSPENKFSLLPHLIRKGTMFDLRLSAIMAVISKIAGSILQEDAVTFLDKIRGKWLDLTLPENNSLDFARLLMKISEYALTPDEVLYFRALILVGSLKKSKDRVIEVEVAYSSNKSKREDYKEKCKTCNQWRSLTLMLDDTCAICISYPGEEKLESERSYSWMCECRICLVHYAVYAVENLKSYPKCHFCREGVTAPFIECSECKNKFLYQKSSPVNNFVCAVCNSKKERVGERRMVTIQNYIAKNNAGFIGMHIENKAVFFDDANKVFKTTPEERLLAVRNFAEITDDDFKDHKLAMRMSTKSVWNVKDLQKQVLEILQKPKLSPCGFCYDEFTEKNLYQICGHKSKTCSTVACKSCLKEWYTKLKPGAVCQPAKLLCPYCKHTPLFRIVNLYNPLLSTVKTETDINAFDPSYIYAWCIKCYTIKKAMERVCNRPNEVISQFRCDECNSKKFNIIIKNCPGCDTPTQKIGGCNHIECKNILENKMFFKKICNTHWCWVCNIKSTIDDIYRHMSKEHGGFFTGTEADIDSSCDIYEEFDSGFEESDESSTN